MRKNTGEFPVFFRFDKKLQKSLFYALAKLQETCYNRNEMKSVAFREMNATRS
jgi:hypothetical protein